METTLSGKNGYASGGYGRALTGTLDERANGVGRLSADAQPMLDAIEVDLDFDFLAFCARAVGTKNLNEATITAGCLLTRNQAVMRGVGGAVALKTDADHVLDICFC